MKDQLLSNNEKAFVEKAIAEGLRIDKRGLDEFRNLSIVFGKKFGSVIVSLGETKVFCSVSCEISTPKTTRPNEGTIFMNVEMGGQQNEACIVVTRILERTIRDSNCLDLETLCIIAEEKVWNLRVDITVLNNEGNAIGDTEIFKFLTGSSLIDIIRFRLFMHSCYFGTCSFS